MGSYQADVVPGLLESTLPGNTPLRLDDFTHPHSMLIASRVLEAIPTMIAVLDRDLRYVYANQRYLDNVNSSLQS